MTPPPRQVAQQRIERHVSNPNVASVTRTLRLKVRAESYSWLNAAAMEVNQVWNWANATSAKAAIHR